MKMDWDLKYGELTKDTEYVNKCEDLKENLMDLQKVLDKLLPLKQHYAKMSLPAQIELDLFFAYTLNSLQWITLRIRGVDPSTHPIKNELLRVKAAMLKWKEVKDREKRPTMNIEAVKRFIRSGLYDSYRTAGQGQPAHFKIIDIMDED